MLVYGVRAHSVRLGMTQEHARAYPLAHLVSKEDQTVKRRPVLASISFRRRRGFVETVE